MIEIGVDKNVLKGAEEFLKQAQLSAKEMMAGFGGYAARWSGMKWKSNIYRQTQKLKRLTPRYLRMKRFKGLDSRILIASGFYINHVTTKKVGKVWYCGVERGLVYPDTDVEVKDVAITLEVGSMKKHLPPRPSWALTAMEVKERIPRWWESYVRMIVNRRMRGVEVHFTRS